MLSQVWDSFFGENKSWFESDNVVAQTFDIGFL